MNNQTTIERMKQMRLYAMAETYNNSMQNNMHRDYTLDQYLALLIDQKWESRYNKRIQNLIANAGFRYPASVQDVNYTANRSLDKNTFERLALLDFIKRGENVILTGATGTGNVKYMIM